MNIKHCNAIVVEENGTKEIFCEDDIIHVEYWDRSPACVKKLKFLNQKRLKATGRMRRLYNGVVWRDWDNVPVFGSKLILDISTEHHENKIEINLDNIISIKKIPD